MCISKIVQITTLVLVGAIFSACSSFRGGDEKKGQLHLQLGTSYLQAGDYPRAMAELLEAEKEDPDNPVIQNNLGLAYFVRERYEAAEKHLLLALKEKSDYSEARNNLARTYIEQGRFQDARDSAEKVLADLTYSNPEKAQINLGLSYFYEKNFEKALGYFSRATELRPDNCLAQNFLGRTWYEMKKYQKAGSVLDRASGICKRDLFEEPTYYGALSYYFLGEKKQAQIRLKELVQLYPQGKYTDKSKALLLEMGKTLD